MGSRCLHHCYTKGAKWLATGTVAPSPHKDAGGNVLYNDGHVAWNNSLSATVGTNSTYGCSLC